MKRLPAHPPEPSYPCYLSILGELAEVTPHGESKSSLPTREDGFLALAVAKSLESVVGSPKVLF